MFWGRFAHPSRRGAHQTRRRGGGQPRRWLGEWESPQGKRLGQRERTHVPLLERWVWFGLGESATTWKGAPKEGT